MTSIWNIMTSSWGIVTSIWGIVTSSWGIVTNIWNTVTSIWDIVTNIRNVAACKNVLQEWEGSTYVQIGLCRAFCKQRHFSLTRENRV